MKSEQRHSLPECPNVSETESLDTPARAVVLPGPRAVARRSGSAKARANANAEASHFFTFSPEP